MDLTPLWDSLHSCLEKPQFSCSNLFLLPLSLITRHSLGFLGFPCSAPLILSSVLASMMLTSPVQYSGHWGLRFPSRGCIQTFLWNLVAFQCTFNEISFTIPQLFPIIFLENSPSCWSLISWDPLFLCCCSRSSFSLEYWTLSLHPNYLPVCHSSLTWNWAKGPAKPHQPSPPPIQSCTQLLQALFPLNSLSKSFPRPIRYPWENSFVPLSFFKGFLGAFESEIGAIFPTLFLTWYPTTSSLFFWKSWISLLDEPPRLFLPFLPVVLLWICPPSDFWLHWGFKEWSLHWIIQILLSIVSLSSPKLQKPSRNWCLEKLIPETSLSLLFLEGDCFGFVVVCFVTNNNTKGTLAYPTKIPAIKAL